ncbi:MAG: porin, partial [Roseovarius sp.]
ATYAENDADTSGGVGDQEGYSLGVDYDLAGPWSVGAQMYRGEEKTANNDNEYEAYLVGGSRDLGAGVSWDVYYYYMETKNGTNGNKIEGNVIATAINLSF